MFGGLSRGLWSVTPRYQTSNGHVACVIKIRALIARFLDLLPTNSSKLLVDEFAEIGNLVLHWSSLVASECLGNVSGMRFIIFLLYSL